MRFYTQRCPKEYRTQAQLPKEYRTQVQLEAVAFDYGARLAGSTPEDRLAADARVTSVSNCFEVIDGSGLVATFVVNERDADFVSAALNAADRQERLCQI